MSKWFQLLDTAVKSDILIIFSRPDVGVWIFLDRTAAQFSCPKAQTATQLRPTIRQSGAFFVSKKYSLEIIVDSNEDLNDLKVLERSTKTQFWSQQLILHSTRK